MKALKIIGLLAVLLAVCGFAAQDDIRFEIAKRREDYPTLVRIAAKRHNVPLDFALAILSVESKERRESIRFEKGQLGLGRKLADEKKIPKFERENQARMFASSHCRLQVMGYHAPKYDLTWLDLYNPEDCVNVAMSEARICLDKSEKEYKEHWKIFQGASRCYNGGNIANKNSEEYAAKIQTHMINQLLSRAV